MATIEISAVGTEPAEAMQIAQELQGELRRAGVDTTIVRDRHDTMADGSILQYVAMGFEVVAVAHTIYEVFIKERCAIRLKTPKGVVEIGPGEVEIERLRSILADALDVQPNS